MYHDVFISHAREDKTDIARPLAIRLERLGLQVWLDEYELTLGDSLRRSIDRGLSQCRFGVVILSPSFFAAEWPKKELDALVAREDGHTKIILPVWHNLDAEEIATYSPMLADRVAVSTSSGLDYVADKILQAVTSDEEEAIDSQHPYQPRPRRSTTSLTLKRWLYAFVKVLVAFAVLDALLEFIFPGLLSGSIRRLYFDLFNEVKVVLREGSLIRSEESDIIQQTFSVANMTREIKYINSVMLRLGDHGGSTGIGYGVWVKKIPKQITIELIRELGTGENLKLLRHYPAANSMGDLNFSLIQDKRLTLNPEEQVDFYLEVYIRRPKDLAGQYNSLWDLGGIIMVDYESPRLRKGHAYYPDRRYGPTRTVNGITSTTWPPPSID